MSVEWNLSFSIMRCSNIWLLVGRFKLARDYSNHLATILRAKDPMFLPQHTELWTDHIPTPAEAESPFRAVDDHMEKLNADARKVSWETDCLKLTRDAAQLGRLYEAECKSERSRRLQKIVHLKEQNVQGAQIISNFMKHNLHMVAGRMGELEFAADQVHLSILRPTLEKTCLYVTNSLDISYSRVLILPQTWDFFFNAGHNYGWWKSSCTTLGCLTIVFCHSFTIHQQYLTLMFCYYLNLFFVKACA